VGAHALVRKGCALLYFALVAATKMSLPEKMSRAWEILSGLGMAVAGVKT
jgi:hypothetical protein